MKRKSEGTIKMIGDLSKRGQTIKRRKWRANARACRTRQKAVEEAEKFVENRTPPATPAHAEVDYNPLRLPQADEVELEMEVYETEQDIVPKTKVCGRKKVWRDRCRVYTTLKKTELKLQQETRRAEMYKKRWQRLQKQGKDTASPSPRTKVGNVIRSLKLRNVPPDLRKRLVFSEVLQKQLRHNARSANGDKQKQLIAKVVSGQVIAKYRGINTINRICSWKRFNSCRGKTDITRYERKQRKTVINDCLKNKVRQFFELDSNSRMCPGRKDCVTKGSVKKQKRLLLDTVRNVYERFKCETGSTLLYASFCNMRPFWVMQLRVQDREIVKEIPRIGVT